jgi:two-component system sensor histidine kinase UhpB
MTIKSTSGTQAAPLSPAMHVPTSMSLRLKINLIFAVLTILVFSILIAIEMNATRNSVAEEMEASGRIASQLLGRIGKMYANKNLPELVEFLRETGRVRAQEISLHSLNGDLLYQSPPSVYKTGRNAPQWYAALITPPESVRVIELSNARITMRTNPTRAILDGWDNLADILFAQSVLFIIADLVIFWLVGVWLAPLEKIERGLREIEQGDHHVRLPALPGKEAGQMGRAFNRMAQAVEENIQVRQATAEAQARLATQREFTQLLYARIEQERAALARELHDELGQSLTGIRSISKSLLQHADVAGSPLQRSAQMLFDTAGMMSDAMHRMIPRLRPIQLEGMGLVDAVRDLLTATQLKNPELKTELEVQGDIPALNEECELHAYRIIQEAITNVVRHAKASRTHVCIAMKNDSLILSIADDGQGAQSLQREGHYGVRGMQERAASIHGNIVFQAAAMGGCEVLVTLPLSSSVHESHHESQV